jgi:hypothetical protein
VRLNSRSSWHATPMAGCPRPNEDVRAAGRRVSGPCRRCRRRGNVRGNTHHCR